MCKEKEEGGLGFRELSTFNRALLAKQIWRIISRPDSLVAQVFKARYFRNIDIMQAPLGSNPSFVWRSLCWGREVIEQGLGWRIGNGNSILASSRHWFSKWGLNMQSTCRENDQKVAAYLLPNRQWNEDLIRRDFLPFEAEEILTTLMEPHLNEDIRYWRPNPSGIYTVKSGYRLWFERTIRERNKLQPTSSDNHSKWWKVGWNLKMPPKVKVFWWSLSWDILPTELNLSRMHVPITSACSLCGFGEASSIHAIFLCPVVYKVWKEEGFVIPKRRNVGKETIEFLELCFLLNDHRPREEVAGMAWAIWKRRCEITHIEDSIKKGPYEISGKQVRWVFHMLGEYKRVCSGNGHQGIDRKWTSIVGEANRIGLHRILMCDASFHQNSGRAGAGVVFLDDKGQVLDWSFTRLQKCANVLEAELKAVLFGLQLANKEKMNSLLIISDSKDTISALIDKPNFLSRGGYTLELISRELETLDKWRAIHVSRILNEAAHFLAKCAKTPIGPRDWINSKVIDFIQNLGSRSC